MWTTQQDERMLSGMGIQSPDESRGDPHASCRARLKDQQDRTKAEEALALRAWTALEQWQERYYRMRMWAAMLATALAVAIAVAIVK
jgi:hypothetical protein